MGRQFNEFKASELHCPQCGSCQPVRERRALDDSLELLCSRCATILGRHTTVDHSLVGKLTRLASGLLGGKK